MKDQTTLSIFMFLGMTALTVAFFWLVVVNSGEPEKEELVEEEQKETEYTPYVIWYEYKDGAWGTHPHDPKTGERGVEIDSVRIELLKIAE